MIVACYVIYFQRLSGKLSRYQDEVNIQTEKINNEPRLQEVDYFTFQRQEIPITANFHEMFWVFITMAVRL